MQPQDQRFIRVETNILRLSKRREGTDDDPADFSGPPLMNNRLRAPLPSLALNPGSGTPVYRQLYAAYRDAIFSGQLRGGTQLPSTRELALELGISRNTVMNGFDQLRAEGYIGGKAGSGTFVENGLAREQDPPVRKQSKPVHHTELSTLRARSSRRHSTERSLTEYLVASGLHGVVSHGLASKTGPCAMVLSKISSTAAFVRSSRISITAPICWPIVLKEQPTCHSLSPTSKKRSCKLSIL